ncbi:dsDNA nuclease domain-containing protein [Pseudomonas fluorescens]|uniref:CD-NTase associated protein 4-like DNA endonuclease domain-containing protein n=1 Tax=Pseudomonas fluorescens TaxID=294 RepID=A0A5E7B297_PSEFL|nr:dsDNA nuclease domain-containing protein [Pseudomonas fluorescens]VVN84760.1 hypothetical protein PS691_01375 [Pseudomonas fluorescens]
MGFPMTEIHEVSPRENVGRDTIARYEAQFRAACIESLSLLESAKKDKIYCDLHDDYVARYVSLGKTTYRFVQVKTRASQRKNLTMNEVFGLLKRKKKGSANNLEDSYFGKMILHIINFKSSCIEISLQTNVEYDEDTNSIIEDIENQRIESKHTTTLISEIKKLTEFTSHTEAQILLELQKLKIETGLPYLRGEDTYFIPIAIEKIREYSEIELQHTESVEILKNILDLVRNKSRNKIHKDITASDLDAIAGITLHDLLNILSISSTGYEILKSSGDSRAIKNTSILQRFLRNSGFPESMIPELIQLKVNWDDWFSVRRHKVPDFSLSIFTSKIQETVEKLISHELKFKSLQSELPKLKCELETISGLDGLTEELLLGSVLKEFVWINSK